MTSEGRKTLRKLAESVYRDPTAPTTTRILARGVLYLIDGKPPQ